jgi:hypothetical protein
MSNDQFSYDAWFSQKLAPDGDIEDGCHPGEAQAMEDYLHGRTTAVQAAQAITQPIMTIGEPEENLPRLWGFLEDSLIELPSKHIEPLIALLQAIEDLPEVSLAKGGKLWKGLGSFGHMWSDGYRHGAWKTEAQNAEVSTRNALRYEHVRKAEIEARMVVAGVGDIPIDWGYEVVADALESSSALLDFEVPAAAKWIVICGQKFRQDAEREEKSWALKRHSTPEPPSPSRDLWKAPLNEVMSLERWSFWKQRLEELQTVSGAVREAAITALQSC